MTRPPQSSSQKSPRIPGLEVDLRRPRSRQPEQYWRRFGQRCGDQGLPRRKASIPGRHDHCRFALQSRPVGGKQQSLWPSPIFRPGPATNIQFMVKDSTKYAATGGWGFAIFIDGKPAAAASMKSCFPCHNQTKATRPRLHALRTLDTDNALRRLINESAVVAAAAIEDLRLGREREGAWPRGTKRIRAQDALTGDVRRPK